MKKYIIFDLDGTLVNSMWLSIEIVARLICENIEWIDYENAKYIVSQSAWSPLSKQIDLICNKEIENKDEIIDKIYDELNKVWTEFFAWVPEKIKELSKSYKLFLTTWNSTKVAEKHLEEAWIFDNFELVLWSNNLLKWNEHLEVFEEYSNDTDFYKNAVYVWDGNADREFAKEKNIDFIHIWNDKIDKYEIASVVEIDNILINL